VPSQLCTCCSKIPSGFGGFAVGDLSNFCAPGASVHIQLQLVLQLLTLACLSRHYISHKPSAFAELVAALIWASHHNEDCSKHL
jgi:hypothetical protein